MKKILTVLLCILNGGVVCALPMGNPADASLLCDGLFREGHCADPCDPCLSWCEGMSFRLGFYGDYVFEKHMEADIKAHPDIEHMTLMTNASYFAVNFWDRFDFFATLGASKMTVQAVGSTFSGAVGVFDSLVNLETNTNFSWSLGARAMIWECGSTLFGLEGQYFRNCSPIHRICVSEDLCVFPDKDLEATYAAWQVGIGLAHRIHFLVPYAGIKWSGASASFGKALVDFNPPTPGSTIVLNNIQNKHYFGYAVGISLVDCEKMALVVEGRWLDETALYVGGHLRF